jgi:hypothetical protein
MPEFADDFRARADTVCAISAPHDGYNIEETQNTLKIRFQEE